MALSYKQLKQISDSVGDRAGWNFSQMCTEIAPVPWKYPDVVRQYLTHTNDVLDIGTGGGEMFLSFASYLRKGVGIDIIPEMIEQAQQNKEAQGIANTEFSVMDSDNLEFPNFHFDAVLNRHSHVNASEIGRVLNTNGYFITQQVGYRNALNIHKAFGWRSLNSDHDEGQTIERLAKEFESIGFRVEAKGEYDVRYWFCDLESLVFWLKSVPLPEPFDVEKHLAGVNRIIYECSTKRGIETNEHRELLIVQKQ